MARAPYGYKINELNRSNDAKRADSESDVSYIECKMELESQFQEVSGTKDSSNER